MRDAARLVERWVWILLYGGLLVLCLGLATVAHDAVLGHALLVAGALAAVAGVALIVVRSRMKS